MDTTVATRTQISTGWERLAGAAAIAFAVFVAASNVMVPSTPDWDASGEEVAKWVTDNHTAVALESGVFAFTAVFLLVFLAGFVVRVRREGDARAQVPAMLAGLGGAFIAATFSAVVASRFVQLSLDGSNPDPSLVGLVWRFEGAAFALNLVSVSIALFGVAWAAATVGLAPSWYKPLSTVALAAGVAGAAQGAATLNGADGWQIGFVPFLAWLLLLVIVGLRMVRETAS
jgi:hypothetical protein